MDCNKASISRVINTVALKGRAACGKQKKTAPQDDRQLCRIAKTNRFWSATQLSQKWGCALGREVSTATTVCRLREMLNHKHKLKRLQWANIHKDWTMLKSHFSNQSKLCIEFGNRGALVWRTKDGRYNPACLKRS